MKMWTRVPCVRENPPSPARLARPDRARKTRAASAVKTTNSLQTSSSPKAAALQTAPLLLLHFNKGRKLTTRFISSAVLAGYSCGPRLDGVFLPPSRASATCIARSSCRCDRRERSRSCRRDVQMSVHDRWSTTVMLTAPFSRHAEILESVKELCGQKGFIARCLEHSRLRVLAREGWRAASASCSREMIVRCSAEGWMLECVP